jgi:hypothetical protein
MPSQYASFFAMRLSVIVFVFVSAFIVAVSFIARPLWLIYSAPSVVARQPLPELNQLVQLCDETGLLNPAAVGWSRKPIFVADRCGASSFCGRYKRWEYWGVVTETYLLGITVADIQYASTHGIYVVDRQTDSVIVDDEAVVPLGVGSEMTDTFIDGQHRVRAAGSRFVASPQITIVDEGAGPTRIVGTTRTKKMGQNVTFDFVIEPRVLDALAVVVPWSAALFQYTLKDPGRRVAKSSSLSIDGKRVELAASVGWAVLDRGRGRWPYSKRWNWGVGQGVDAATGRVLALQLGAKWTAGTGSSECAFFVDGKMTYLGLEPEWTYDDLRNASKLTRPWKVSGPRVDATFVPDVHTRKAAVELVLLSFSVVQQFGHWSGRVKLDDSTWLSFDNLVGWAEEAANRW